MDPILAIPTEALKLLGRHFALYTEAIARGIAAHSRGGLVVVRCEKEWLLIPAEQWDTVEPDVRGLIAEVEHVAQP